MATKNSNDELSAMIDAVIADTVSAKTKKHHVVDIITFCDDSRYLALLDQQPPLELWPMQKIVLKLFYRGSEGNEHIKLTEDEIEVLREISKTEDLDYNEKQGGFGQIIDKYERETQFSTLLLVMGRRSSKTLMTSIIAAYEAYKLLEKPDGNPQAFYKMAANKPICILNVAASEKQAYDPLFIGIQNLIASAPYFEDKINNASSKKGELHLLTSEDKRENARREAKGNKIMLEGSVVLKSGHSNSRTQRGQAIIAVLFDEFAHFLDSSGANSGDKAYNALEPSVKQFQDPEGRVHGRIVLLSDPAGRDGMFWTLFQMAEETRENEQGEMYYPYDQYLAIQLPTWRMNPSPAFSRAALEPAFRSDPIAAQASYGAKFLEALGSRFFDESRLDQCIHPAGTAAQVGDPKFIYHIHLDPAKSAHNYALAMTHVQTFTAPNGEQRRKVFLDLIKYWRPTGDGPINIDHIEKFIRDLCRRFRVGSVTFDQFQSTQTIQRLKLSGINAYETLFTPTYEREIYGELRTLINQGDIQLYPDPQLIGEMRFLQQKVLRDKFEIKPDKNSPFPFDDCCDALAGSTYVALKREVIKTLPRTQLVYMRR